ncbi:MAG: VOC family protein [Herpetosiphon sp.]
MAGQPIVHVDFPAKDPQAAAKFYEQAFGWQLQHDASVDYWMFSVPGGPGGGFVAVGQTDGPHQHEIGKPLIYLASENIEADLARIQAAGGHTILSHTSLGPWGAYAIFADPSGNYVGLYQNAAPASS